MNHIEIPARNIYKEYPGEWGELTIEQASYAGELLFMLSKGELDVDMFRKLMVDRFINHVNQRAPRMDRPEDEDRWGNEAKLMETVNFFFKITKNKKTKKEEFEILPCFTENLIPRVRAGWRWLYGPGNFLQGMSFAEFKDALECCEVFMREGDINKLDELMAVLYRRNLYFVWIRRRIVSFDGNLRVRYVPEQRFFRKKKFRNVPVGTKYMAFLYVMGCMYNLRTDGGGDGIEINGVECRTSILFNRKGGNDGGSEGIGLTGVLFGLAESGVFGSLHETADTDVWDVIARLLQLEIQRREMKS